MAKQNDVGVFQLDNGKWAFRYTFTKNGKRSSRRSCKDEFGNPLNTKRAAIKARKSAVEAETLNQPLKPIIHKTVAEVFKRHRGQVFQDSSGKIQFSAYTRAERPLRGVFISENGCKGNTKSKKNK